MRHRYFQSSFSEISTIIGLIIMGIIITSGGGKFVFTPLTREAGTSELPWQVLWVFFFVDYLPHHEANESRNARAVPSASGRLQSFLRM